MTLQDREKKTIIVSGVLAVLMIAYWALTREEEVPGPVLPVATTIPQAELQLKRMRELAASVPARQEILKQASADLAVREKGLIQADTAAQAQAQLVETLRKLGRTQQPAINLRNSEIGPVKTYGDRYGEVTVSVNFEARIEQIVQLLSDVTAQKEIIGVNDVRIGAANPKEKIMPVRLTISGLVRRQLVPEKKGSL